MFSHVMVGSNNIERSKSFYNAVLGTLGAGEPMVDVKEDGTTRLFYIHNSNIFSVSQPIDGQSATVANGATIGFACSSPEQVKEFHDVAIDNGAKSIEDPPGPRSSTMGEMHLSYVRDPDGHKLCAMYRPG
ncbi:MAG: VOC family protein [Parasphingorhabdus sp.]|uniref:VOC family protein n=1 Tax=Parasphingorhabdus sp. TaxID=2709688 RepID=UPI003299A6BA